MEAPDTQFLLEFVRPDFLLLRILAKGLILWDEVMPSRAWLDTNIPEIIRANTWSGKVYLVNEKQVRSDNDATQFDTLGQFLSTTE